VFEEAKKGAGEEQTESQAQVVKNTDEWTPSCHEQGNEV